MLFTTNWLSTFFTNYHGRAEDPIPINSVSTDSRQELKKSLFIPIIGDTFDGHHFLKQAFNNGAVATLWNKDYELPHFLPNDFPVFFVDDTLAALQQLSSLYREKVNPIVIGITGSNGKTTTKDIVSAVLQTKYRTHKTIGNLNNHIGLPLTILSMENDTEVLVVEMGMNRFGEIATLTKIARPDHAIITNIGESHIEYLKSRHGIAKAKLEIVEGLNESGTLIIDGDEQLLNEVHHRKNVIKCGFQSSNDVMIKQVGIDQDKTSFQLSNGNTYMIPLLGKHHVKNATYAIALANQLNIQNDMIQTALMDIDMTGMRFEMIKGVNDVTIINDAYNASPTSMKAAIDVVKQLERYQEKVLVLGDIFELGNDSEQWHRSVAEVITEPITALFTYGNAAQFISLEVKKQKQQIQCQHIHTKSELIEALQNYLHEDAVILFKASRGMHFETLIETVVNDSN